MSDRLVLQPVRLPLERFAFEIADGLPDLCDDRAIRSSMKAHRLDVRTDHGPLRSEEHTSELQSRQYLVCRLLLEKKKKKTKHTTNKEESASWRAKMKQGYELVTTHPSRYKSEMLLWTQSATTL